MACSEIYGQDAEGQMIVTKQNLREYFDNIKKTDLRKYDIEELIAKVREDLKQL